MTVSMAKKATNTRRRMKNQRWPGDYETVPQEFKATRRQEDMGLAGQNASHGNDYVTMGQTSRLDAYQMGELEPSRCTDLDTNGMQPHAREYLERDAVGIRSRNMFTSQDGQTIDFCPGIQFSGTP